MRGFICFYGMVAHCSFHSAVLPKNWHKAGGSSMGYGTLSVLGTVLCMLIKPRSSEWFQTVVWTSVTARWQTCGGTICQLSLRKLITSKFKWAEYELAVPGGNFLEVCKPEDAESEGPWSQPREAATRRRLELRCKEPAELESSHCGQQDKIQVNSKPFGGGCPFLYICLPLQWLQILSVVPFPVPQNCSSIVALNPCRAQHLVYAMTWSVGGCDSTLWFILDLINIHLGNTEENSGNSLAAK